MVLSLANINRMKKQLLFLFLMGAFCTQLLAQRSITSFGSPLTENFNQMVNTGTGVWNQDSVNLRGWYAYKTNAFSAYNIIYADTGGSNSGRLFSYGSTAASDRALGSLASGSTDRVCYGWRLRNTTGSTINRLSLNYYGEQWRQAGTGENRLYCYYKIANRIDSLTYDELKYGVRMTRNTKLEYESPQKSTTARALNGNDSANRVFVADTMTVSLPDNFEIFIVWIDSNDVGSDNGLSLDDMSLTALVNADVTAPEVSSVNLIGKDTIIVAFSEPVEKSSAQNTSNYVLNPTATISSATLDTATNKVTLVTGLTPSVSYALIIKNVKDLAASPNTMAEDTFYGLMYNPFSASLKISSYKAISNDTIEVVFNESVLRSSAEDKSNYKFSPAATVSNVSYDSANNKVWIFTSLTSGKKHSLMISGILDMGTPAKIIMPDTLEGLIYNTYSGSALLFTEISYNDRNGPDPLEFVEIYNNGNTTIEMGGISFSKGITFTFDEFALAAKKSAIITRYSDTFEQVFGFKPHGIFTGGLSNSGEAVEIVNGKGRVLDQVTFDDAAPWDVRADGAGPSLQLLSYYANTTDNDNGANWIADYGYFALLPGGDTIWASPGVIPTHYGTISKVRREGADGVNVANGSKAELRGVVYGVNQRPTGLQFSLIDATGAVSVFSTTATFGYTVKEGDSLHVKGALNQFRGLAQVESLDTVMFIASNRPLKDAVVMSKPNEAGESDLIKVLSYTIITTDANWVSNKNYSATNGTDTIQVRIDGDTEIDGNPIPAGPLNITGLGAQFDATIPLTEGYQILPRYNSDFETLTSVPDPEIAFSTTAATVKESDGSYKVSVKITNPNTNATNFTIRAKGGNAVSNVDYTAALPANRGFAASTSTPVELQITLLKDANPDGSKTLELVLENPDNNATIGADSVFTLTITDDDVAVGNIATLKAINAEGRPSGENQKVRVKGIVYGVDIRGGNGFQFTVIDNSGGLAVFSPAAEFGYSVKEGDEVTVQGNLGFFNGLTQITFLDTVIFHSSGNTLKSPIVVNTVNESTESDLVKLEKVWFVSDTITVWPSNGSVWVTNGTTQTDIRIDRDVLDVAGSAVPTYDTMNIAGLGGQFDASTPFTEGYQLMPRYKADIQEWKNPNTGSVSHLTFKVSVYPNPAQGNILVNAETAIHQWEMKNISGHTVISGQPNAKTFDVDLSSLKPGVYFIELANESRISRMKVIKQ